MIRSIGMQTNTSEPFMSFVRSLQMWDKKCWIVFNLIGNAIFVFHNSSWWEYIRSQPQISVGHWIRPFRPVRTMDSCRL